MKKYFICNFCDLLFDNQDAWDYHVNTKHDNTGEFLEEGDWVRKRYD